MMWGWNGGYGLMSFFGPLFMILFWVLIIGLIVWVVREVAVKGNGVKKEDGAMETLRGRYAKGEITKDEFDQMKKDLQ